jgi:hypothetical protein
MCRVQVLVAILLIVCVAGCDALYGDPLLSTQPRPQNPGAPQGEVGPILKARTMDVSAMVGTWVCLDAGGVPARLHIRQAAPGFVVVGVALARNAPGVDGLEWMTVRAKLLEGGRLFWKHPGEFTLELSEDHATLIGTKRQLGRSSQFLLRKAEAPDPAGEIARAVKLGS